MAGAAVEYQGRSTTAGIDFSGDVGTSSQIGVCLYRDRLVFFGRTAAVPQHRPASEPVKFDWPVCLRIDHPANQIPARAGSDRGTIASWKLGILRIERCIAVSGQQKVEAGFFAVILG